MLAIARLLQRSFARSLYRLALRRGYDHLFGPIVVVVEVRIFPSRTSRKRWQDDFSSGIERGRADVALGRESRSKRRAAKVLSADRRGLGGARSSSDEAFAAHRVERLDPAWYSESLRTPRYLR